MRPMPLSSAPPLPPRPGAPPHPARPDREVPGALWQQYAQQHVAAQSSTSSPPPSYPGHDAAVRRFVNQQGQQQLDEQERDMAALQAQSRGSSAPFWQHLLDYRSREWLTLCREKPPTIHVRLTPEQRQHFLDFGYLQVPGVVPRPLIDRALRAINRHLARSPEENKVKIPRSITSCPDLVASKVLMDLLTHSPALAHIEQLVGKINFPRTGQIALRYPGDGCLRASVEKFGGAGLVGAINQSNPLVGGVLNQIMGSDDEDSFYTLVPRWEDHWHIDGFPDAVNGFRTGTVRNFTMLIGILLSDVPDEYMGNFTVYPGAHHTLEQYFRQQGGVLQTLQGTTFEGIQRVKDGVRHNMPAPVQMRGRAGDIILAHYQLPHAIAPNTSPHIRYACYFRLHNERHPLETSKPQVMTDIWCDFDGLRDLTAHLRERR